MATAKSPAKKEKKSLKDLFVFPLSPRRQFRRLMIVMSFVCIATLTFHLYFIRRIESGVLFPVPPPAVSNAGEVLNAAKLTNVLARYDSKAAVRAAAMSLVPVVTEPSK